MVSLSPSQETAIVGREPGPCPPAGGRIMGGFPDSHLVPVSHFFPEQDKHVILRPPCVSGVS